MRIISWNVHSLTAGPEKVAAALLDEEPSLIALQEYPSGPNAAAAEAIFAANGLAPFKRHAKARPFRTIVFAPQGARLSPSPPDLVENDPFWVDVQLSSLGVSAAHIAIPKNAALREMHWQVALSLVSSRRDAAHILIGDLNTTRHGIDQEGATISGDHHLQTLEAAGWSEAWRSTHAAPAPREYSWYYKDIGFRFDQAWLSPTLAPRLIGAHMNHDVRERGLSDHSMLVVDVDV
ncbi:MAG TPA: endonuclease/exonuclease/phosphatase family protein [Stellaceae bacterium]|nr:endonuclease/exonuclease/phosphatase family protein [Stellaceae bacterium]